MADIASISIRGYKSIRDAHVELRKLNVLIGPNGSGKSNFIGVFSLLRACRERELEEYVARAGGAERLLHFGSKTTQKIAVNVALMAPMQYLLLLVASEGDRLSMLEEAIAPGDDSLTPVKGEKDWAPGLGRWWVYHFHDTSSSSPMKKTADVNDNRYLRPDGSNLAAFLYFLKQKHGQSYSMIRRTVQRVAPFFDDFQLESQRLNAEKILLEWRHRKSDAYFSASSLSDGTLRFIALATLFLQPEEYRPSLILVDEPELGLHPSAITLLASLAKQASVKTQTILSTQSPILLDHFAPEDVIVADRVEEATQFRRLDPEQLKVWLEDYSLGQLWEKNELGGRPGGM